MHWVHEGSVYDERRKVEVQPQHFIPFCPSFLHLNLSIKIRLARKIMILDVLWHYEKYVIDNYSLYLDYVYVRTNRFSFFTFLADLHLSCPTYVKPWLLNLWLETQWSHLSCQIHLFLLTLCTVDACTQKPKHTTQVASNRPPRLSSLSSCLIWRCENNGHHQASSLRHFPHYYHYIITSTFKAWMNEYIQANG